MTVEPRALRSYKIKITNKLDSAHSVYKENQKNIYIAHFYKKKKMYNIRRAKPLRNG